MFNRATKYTPGFRASYDSIITDHNPSQLCRASNSQNRISIEHNLPFWLTDHTLPASG